MYTPSMSTESKTVAPGWKIPSATKDAFREFTANAGTVTQEDCAGALFIWQHLPAQIREWARMDAKGEPRVDPGFWAELHNGMEKSIISGLRQFFESEMSEDDRKAVMLPGGFPYELIPDVDHTRREYIDILSTVARRLSPQVRGYLPDMIERIFEIKVAASQGFCSRPRVVFFPGGYQPTTDPFQQWTVEHARQYLTSLLWRAPMDLRGDAEQTVMAAVKQFRQEICPETRVAEVDSSSPGDVLDAVEAHQEEQHGRSGRKKGARR